MTEQRAPYSSGNAPRNLSLLRDGLGQAGIEEGLKLSKGARVGSIQMPAGVGDIWLENSIRYSTALSAGCYQATQGLGSSTSFSALLFETEEWDTDEICDLVTYPSRLTFQTGGIYMITGCARIGVMAAGYCGLEIYLNATTTLAMQHCPFIVGLAVSLTVAIIYQVKESDIVELRAQQNSGGAVNATDARFAVARFA